MFGLLAGALFTGMIGTLGARFVWENGMHYACTLGTRLLRGRHSDWMADLDRLFGVPLGSSLMCFRFLQVALELRAHRRTAAP